jgi:protein-S-isoprenylcysteine O-methyltransferase Ste14
MIRSLVLALPLAALGACAWCTRPDLRTRGAALLAFAAASIGIAALNAVAGAVGWWSFAAVEGNHLGVPVDLWLGWAVLWGPLPVLTRLPVPLLLGGLLWLDVTAMTHLDPLLRLGPHWLIGDVIGLVAVAAPSILLGRWTADRRHLVGRAVLQVVTFAAGALWLIPATAIDLGDGSWQHLRQLPRWQLSITIQAAAALAVPGVLAVREFVQRGHGTPYPWDPPTRLVTTGPYAYVANPMQISALALFAVAAVATRSWSMAAAGVLTAAFSAAVASPHEQDDLTRRHGAAWASYRVQVRPWWPRWRPYVAAPARLYLARTCDICSSTAHALGRIGPVGLEIVAAEAYGRDLTRARYEGPDGHIADGVAAVARGVEHVNLGWAVAGWILRVPLLDRLAQVIVDGLGGGPRRLSPPEGAPQWQTPGKS